MVDYRQRVDLEFQRQRVQLWRPDKKRKEEKPEEKEEGQQQDDQEDQQQDDQKDDKKENPDENLGIRIIKALLKVAKDTLTPKTANQQSSQNGHNMAPKPKPSGGGKGPAPTAEHKPPRHGM